MTRFRPLLSLLAGLAQSCGGVTQETYPSPPVYVGGMASAADGGAGGSSLTSTGGGGTGGAMRPDPPSDADGVWPSIGCGRALPAEQVPTIPGSRIGYTEFFVTQTGATLGIDEPSKAGERQFFVRVPADYDQNRPYRVVYVGHGCGAKRAGNTNTYPLFNENEGGSEQAIYVAVSLPDNDANPYCYDNNSGSQSQEWEAFDLIHTFVDRQYCVDNNRVFVAGFSTGAWLANMWGCYFGGPSPERRFAPQWRIRGRAAVAGNLPPNQPMPCSGPSAGLWLHDVNDLTNPLSDAAAALDLALQANGCTGSHEAGPKEPWAPAGLISGLNSSCQRYTGCPADVLDNYPLVFCTSVGQTRSDHSAGFIPAFDHFVSEMAPAP